jgi:glycosyltransferase involved in cell wall biosynthesis
MNNDQRRSVLIVVASNRRRGAEVFGEQLSDGLAQLGWDVDFVALQSVDSDRVVGAVPLSDHEGLGRLDVATVRLLRQRIASTNPTVILANGGPTLRYTVAARATLRHRPVLAYASIGEPRYWLRSRGHTLLQKFLHRRVDVVLAVSQMTKTQLVDDLHVGESRVHVAHTGVASEHFIDSDDEHEGLRIVFLGSLSNEKNPQGAFRVVEALDKDHDVSMRFVGDGPLAGDLAAQVRTSSLGGTVSFTGSVNDVMPHLRWADVLILTSLSEGLPGASLEAGAASVPVVAYDVGGTSETMIDGRTGILVEAGDENAMVAAVGGLAMDSTRTSEMGQAARMFVEENFTLDKAIKRYDAILSEATTQERPR